MRQTLLSLAALLALAAPAIACDTVTQGDVMLRNAWSRVSTGTQQPGVVYVEITNTGSRDDALIGLATPAAMMPMLHRTVVENGVSSMPHVMRIDLPAGQTVRLTPGDYHAMLMGLVAPLKEGDRFPVTFQFEQAGAATISANVLSLRADPPVCDGN